MKIIIKIPEWAENGKLILLSGMELVAYKNPNQNFFKIKETKCNLCGKCCMNNPQTPFGNYENGWCKKLKKINNKYECIAGTNKPYKCLKDPINLEVCCITYKKIDI